MSSFDPAQTRSGAEPAPDHDETDAPFPTRFGRDASRRRRWHVEPGPARAAGEPRQAPDDESPFGDEGGL